MGRRLKKRRLALVCDFRINTPTGHTSRDQDLESTNACEDIQRYVQHRMRKLPWIVLESATFVRQDEERE